MALERQPAASDGSGGRPPCGYEPAAIVLVLLTAFVLRVVYAVHFRVDTDEPQHLHVAWGWSQGLMQYRDVFDNHAPLFHLLCAPLVWALGDRADILVLMRLAMVPLYAASLAAVYAIGRTLYSARVGLWAVAFAAGAPSFFLKSIEFRTDDLWATTWLVLLAVLVGGRLTTRRSFVVGVLLGATFAVSLKTTMLFVGLVVGAVLARVAARADVAVWRRDAVRIAVALIGAAVVPMTIVAWFAWKGAFHPLFYGTIAHNTLPGLGLWHKRPWRAVLLPASVVPLGVGTVLFGYGAPTAGIAARRRLVFAMTATFLVLLGGAWPLITGEDFIPSTPLLALLLTPAILMLRDGLVSWSPARARWRPLFAAIPLLIAASQLATVVYAYPPWRDAMNKQTTLIASVLQLTDRDDYVMDLKGESVFRRRPYFYVLEYITKERLERGLLRDTIADDLVATSTPIVLQDRPGYPWNARAFMDQNYLPVSGDERLRVLGRMLVRDEGDRSIMSFDVVVPARYSIVADRGVVEGLLDGVPYGGARALGPGHHEFRTSVADERFALFWARAADRGLSPFSEEGAGS